VSQLSSDESSIAGDDAAVVQLSSDKSSGAGEDAAVSQLSLDDSSSFPAGEDGAVVSQLSLDTACSLAEEECVTFIQLWPSVVLTGELLSSRNSRHSGESVCADLLVTMFVIGQGKKKE
jgi:hypothetical protein